MKKPKLRRLLFLASPYSHKNWPVRDYRFESAREAVRWLIRSGYHVFSPIVFSHYLTDRYMPGGGLRWDWPGWYALSIDMLRRSDALVVLRLDGWKESKGVKREIREAKRLKLPVVYLDLGDDVVDIRKKLGEP